MTASEPAQAQASHVRSARQGPATSHDPQLEGIASLDTHCHPSVPSLFTSLTHKTVMGRFVCQGGGCELLQTVSRWFWRALALGRPSEEKPPEPSRGAKMSISMSVVEQRSSREGVQSPALEMLNTVLIGKK